MTLCRDVDGVEWAKVRSEVDGILAREADRAKIDEEIAAPTDPEAWGRTPAQAAAQRRAMGMGAGQQ